MVQFAFRQRVGKINWNVVSAVSLQDVIQHLKVNELQSVLDAITFCEFGSSDVKNCPIDTVAQLIQIFQFIVEFLLHSQENQNILIEKIHKKNNLLKNENRQLSTQVVSLKEDTKIYQRQLSVLRQSMNIREPQHPRIVDLKPKKESGEIQPIIASVLQSEKESRDLLRLLLLDQRNDFMKELELSRLTAAAAAEANAASSESKNQETRIPSNEESLAKFMTQIKEILIQQQEQQKLVLDSTLSNYDRNRINDSSNNLALAAVNTRTPDISVAVNDEENLKNQKLQSELIILQKELAIKSKELTEKEETLLFDIKDFKNLQKAEKEKQNAKIYLSSIDNLAALKPSNEESLTKLREKSRVVSAMTIKSLFVQALSRQTSKAFRCWVNKVTESKDRSQTQEYSRLLTSSAASHTRREQELVAQIQIEKQRAIVEQARSNTALKTTERAKQEQLEALRKQQESQQQKEQEQQMKSYASVMTSVELQPTQTDTMPSAHSGFTMDPWLLAMMKMRLGSAMTGDEALSLANQRISEKRQSGQMDTPQKDHMNVLAAEIATRLKTAEPGSENPKSPIGMRAPRKV